MRRNNRNRFARSKRRAVAVWALAILFAWGDLGPVSAANFTLKDGRVLEGRIAPIASMAENPYSPAGVNDARLIILCDDNLRRVFVPKRQIVPGTINETDLGDVVEVFRIWQPVARNGRKVVGVGPIIRITPFDEFGRRTVTMNTLRGPLTIIQGITEITPKWTKVEALTTERADYIWDQRLATSSIPRETLDQILAKEIDPTDIEDRLKIARFYLNSERVKEAEQYLEQIINDFPQRGEQFIKVQRDLKQQAALRIVSEIRVRQQAGQHRLAYALLDQFPAEGVAGETLQTVRQMLDEYENRKERGAALLAQIRTHLTQVQKAPARARIEAACLEILAELNYTTLDRMAPYVQFADDDSMTVEEKLALAISGWLVGANTATRNLPVALSLYETRDLVRRYLRDPVKLSRDQIFAEMASQEGAAPRYVAEILSHMKPPLELPAAAQQPTPGLYKLEVEVVPGQPMMTYYLQLPLEYDPYRRYPVVLSLHGAGTTPEQQVDWWAGSYDPKVRSRLGQATRYGYIVVAPGWSKEGQVAYQYSAEEHAAALNTLRDAARRVAIDTDRVFLSGHSMGGDAAWDIALAHPDLWAGVIPIVAKADRFVAQYWRNAEYVPFYLVSGELDGTKAIENARDLDRYLTGGFEATVVEYRGRGHENFSDEILHLFDWMERYRRDFVPREFTCRAMRPWDNFFWWTEFRNFPERTMAHPSSWPPPRGTIPAVIKASINQTNSVYVRSAAEKTTLWLTPDIVDFSERVELSVNGRRTSLDLQPDLLVLLEDARTRGDRLHPFWAKIEMP